MISLQITLQKNDTYDEHAYLVESGQRKSMQILKLLLCYKYCKITNVKQMSQVNAIFVILTKETNSLSAFYFLANVCQSPSQDLLMC